jgi:hypothetical protein
MLTMASWGGLEMMMGGLGHYGVVMVIEEAALTPEAVALVEGRCHHQGRVLMAYHQ